MADQTAMEKWEAWLFDLTGMARDPRGGEIPDAHHAIRLALEAAPSADLVAELRRRGVLEKAAVYGHEGTPRPLYRINPDALEEGGS